MQGNGGGDDGVQNSFGNLLAAAIGSGVVHGRVAHQMAHIAHKQQRAAMQHHGLAVNAGVDAVRVEAAGEGRATLGDGLGERALQNAQPVAVAVYLVFGVDGGDRILQIEDGGKSRLQHQITDAGRIFLANGRFVVNHQIEVQAVVLQQHRRGTRSRALETHKLGFVLQAAGAAVFQAHDQAAGAHAVAKRMQVRARTQRHRAVQHMARVGDDFFTALGVVRLAAGAAFTSTIVLRNYVGSVQGVIQAAPAGIGGVEGVAGVEHWHHELRPGLDRQLGVHIFGRDARRFRYWNQIPDLLQKRLVSRHIADGTGMRVVPGIELGLQALALGQQGCVFRCQVRDDGVKARPESLWLDPRSG